VNARRRKRFRHLAASAQTKAPWRADRLLGLPIGGFDILRRRS
jgi:hypothetical protein